MNDNKYHINAFIVIAPLLNVDSAGLLRTDKYGIFLKKCFFEGHLKQDLKFEINLTDA